MALAELKDTTNVINTSNTVETVLERSNMVKARRLVRLSQIEVAKALKITEPTIVSWEKGRSTPRLYQLKDLCAILQWSGSDEELQRIQYAAVKELLARFELMIMECIHENRTLAPFIQQKNTPALIGVEFSLVRLS